MKLWSRFITGTSILLLSAATLTGCSTTPPTSTTNETAANTNVNPSTTNGSTESADASTQTANQNTNMPSASNSNSKNAGTQPVQSVSSPFPSIIQMAMNHVPADSRQDAKAPTMFPVAANGSSALFYKAFGSTTPPMNIPAYISSYNVNLSSSAHHIAEFGGTHYASQAKAAAGFNFQGDISIPEGPISTIQLASGHTGQFSFTESDKASMIYWTEGRWQIRVSNNSDTKAPTQYANQVVSYLDAHFMPVPRDKGTILVTLKGPIVEVSVTWMVGANVYTIVTNQYCKNPVQTALAMTISMQSFQY